MKNNLVLAFLFLLPFASIEANERNSFEIPRTQIIPIQDTKSGRQYELYIKLPKAYSENKNVKYPVIYFTDAVWHIEILSAATESLMKDVILVGISWQKDIGETIKKQVGVHASRNRDYSVRESSDPEIQAKYQLGQPGNHLAFIRKDVIKYVENNYQTDSGNRTYFGYSAGGVFGAYILLVQPDTFKNYVLGSPALINKIPNLAEFESKAALKPKKLNANVFISHGKLETELGEHAENFITLLKNKNDASLSLKHVVLEGNHQTAFPLTGVSAVTWLSTLKNDGDEYPILAGPYMGQKPPGLVAEPFAPGIISKEGWEVGGMFAPGMKEFYYTTRRASPTVIGFRQKNNVWKKYIEFKRTGGTTFSPDGKRIHMAKGFKDRLGDGWSERLSLGPMFDREDLGIMRLTASSKGTYVFDDYKSDGVIRISTLEGDKRQAPKEMSSVVNTGKMTAHPFIAPDESYLIWDSEREGGYGDSDLYISFRQKDGSMGPAINLGDKINSDKWDAFASVTPDGKFILFNRGVDNHNSDIYWVDAQIIEDLRPKS